MTYTPPIYLDSCATTPPASEVLEAMAAVHAEAWANPSSLHGFGLAAAERLERSRQRIAEILGCGGSQVIVTSGEPSRSTWPCSGPPPMVRRGGC